MLAPVGPLLWKEVPGNQQLLCWQRAMHPPHPVTHQSLPLMVLSLSHPGSILLCWHTIEAPSRPLPFPWAAASRAAEETAARARLATVCVQESWLSHSVTPLPWLLLPSKGNENKLQGRCVLNETHLSEPSPWSHRAVAWPGCPAPPWRSARSQSQRQHAPKGTRGWSRGCHGMARQLCPPQALCLGLCYLLSQQRQQLPGKGPADSSDIHRCLHTVPYTLLGVVKGS